MNIGKMFPGSATRCRMVWGSTTGGSEIFHTPSRLALEPTKSLTH